MKDSEVREEVKELTRRVKDLMERRQIRHCSKCGHRTMQERICVATSQGEIYKKVHESAPFTVRVAYACLTCGQVVALTQTAEIITVEEDEHGRAGQDRT